MAKRSDFSKVPVKSEYQKLLLDPKWQRKRLEILQRDDFTCQKCGEDASTLHVHHKVYWYGNKPWEYHDPLLVTLCEVCHAEESLELKPSCDQLSLTVREKFYSGDIWALAEAMGDLKYHHLQEVLSSIRRIANG